MNRRVTLAGLLVCLLVCVVGASAQGVCTMQNIAGRYAFNFTGSSAIVFGPAADTFHWNSLYAPIAGVGVFALNANGTASGSYWVIAGAMNLGLDPIPLEGTYTLNDDCTGMIYYTFAGSPMAERFVILENGRELRSVAVQTAAPTSTWLTSGRRIEGTCGQNKIRGRYLFECKNLIQLPINAPNIFAGAFHIFMQIAPGGAYTGMLYGKVGPAPGEFPVAGTVTVNDDCTVEATQVTPATPGATNVGKGVFFEQGRKGYFMPLQNQYQGGATNPQLYGYCDVTQMEP